jgi:fructose-bisphosphate aldolase, class II
MTDAQFYYTARKRAIGPFKAALWDMPADAKDQITAELEQRFALMFQRLNVTNTVGLVRDLTSVPRLERQVSDALSDVQVEGE